MFRSLQRVMCIMRNCYNCIDTQWNNLFIQCVTKLTISIFKLHMSTFVLFFYVYNLSTFLYLILFIVFWRFQGKTFQTRLLASECLSNCFWKMYWNKHTITWVFFTCDFIVKKSQSKNLLVGIKYLIKYVQQIETK